MDDRMQWYDPPLKDTLRNLAKELNLAPPVDEEFWGEWIEQNIQSNTDTSQIDSHYLMPYKKSLGFKFALDGMHNTVAQNWYGAICSLNPPGSLYFKDDKKVDESDCRVVTNYIWNSP